MSWRSDGPPRGVSPSLRGSDKTVDAKSPTEILCPLPATYPSNLNNPAEDSGCSPASAPAIPAAQSSPRPARACDALGQHLPASPLRGRVPAPEQAASVHSGTLKPGPALLCTSTAATIYSPPPRRLLTCLTSLDTLPGTHRSSHLSPASYYNSRIITT